MDSTNWLDVSMDYNELPEMDYAGVLAATNPEVLGDQRGSIYPEEPLKTSATAFLADRPITDILLDVK